MFEIESTKDLSRVFVKYGFWNDTEDIFYLHQTEVYEALIDMLLAWAGASQTAPQQLARPPRQVER